MLNIGSEVFNIGLKGKKTGASINDAPVAFRNRYVSTSMDAPSCACQNPLANDRGYSSNQRPLNKAA